MPAHPKRRTLRNTLIIGGAAVAVGCLVAALTPAPSALLIRTVFEADARATVEEMEQYVPDVPLDEEHGISYAEGDPDATLSVYRPAEQRGPLPTVVWVHGGAWISGVSSDVEPYLQILAAEGYTTVGINYSLGPERTYPDAPAQVNQALEFLNEHASDYGIDPEQFVLAGDSAGAQLVSQVTALTTNPEYAALLDITPALRPKQVVANVLNCGVYDLQSMAELSGIVSWGFKTALWAYTGTKNWSETYAGATMSSINYVTEDFPATFISGGNGDALTWLQSIPMSQRLQAAGVETETLFFPYNQEPKLPHEYQFHLDLDEAQTALQETLSFLDRVTEPAAPSVG